MPSAEAVTISLTPELRRYIDEQVASGRYQTTSEVVRAGLRLLTREDPPRYLQSEGVLRASTTRKR
ncbi:type II toxin-antitoxin system ParD family antitoxin [Teichococcus aestuarii]